MNLRRTNRVIAASSKRRRAVPVAEALEARGLLTSLPGFAGIVSGAGALTPPDPTDAAGPVSLLAADNNAVQLQSKAGLVIDSAALGGASGFFRRVTHQDASAGLATQVDGPSALYDPYSGRFIVTATETQVSGGVFGGVGATRSYLLIAVSTSSSPLGLDLGPGAAANWLFYSVSTSENYANGSGSGLAYLERAAAATDGSYLYVACDYANFGAVGSQVFQQERVIRLDGASLRDGSFDGSSPADRVDSVVLGTTAPLAPFGLVPVQRPGPAVGGPQLFVDAPSSYANGGLKGTTQGLRVWSINPATARLTQVGVVNSPASFDANVGAPQLATTIRLGVGDARLTGAVEAADGSIYTAQTILGADGSDKVRWFQVGTVGGVVLRQVGTINPGVGASTFDPAIAVDPLGDAGLTYTQSSAAQFPAMMFAGRHASDAAGSLPLSSVVRASNAPEAYGTVGGSPVGWGPSAGIAVDPGDASTFWAFGLVASGFAPPETWFGAMNLGMVPLPGLHLDGPGVPDLVDYQPSTGTWFIATLSASGDVASTRAVQFGQPFVDVPVPADYDGDGRTDLAVYRPTTGQWIVDRSAAGPEVVAFGAPMTDVPTPADYDGDGRADIAFYRPSGSFFAILQSTAGPRVTSIGLSGGSIPVPGDYDGDGKADPATFSPGLAAWAVAGSRVGNYAFAFGPQGFLATPVPAYYDGDARLDPAVYVPLTGNWFIRDSTTGGLDPRSIAFGPGLGQSIPVPGVYDAASPAELAVYRPFDGGWYISSAIPGRSRRVGFGVATNPGA